MPELPEVETARRGIAPYVEGQHIHDVIVRQRQLRWPVPARLKARIRGRRVEGVGRRGKYLLLRLDRATLIVHLGMSGVLRVLNQDVPAGKHDHWDLVIGNNRALRFTDPRRFGSLHLSSKPETHPLLIHLGPEPLSEGLSGQYLYTRSRGRRSPVKHFLMDARTVAGVGNIYVCEALYLAGIHPRRAAGRIGPERYQRLVDAVKQVLTQAIAQGGTTLRDFLNADGKPGYFSMALQAYGRDGEACGRCGATIKRITQSQRGTWYCPGCQC